MRPTVTGATRNIDFSKGGLYLRPGAGTEPSVPGCGGSGSEASCERVVAGQQPIRDGDVTPPGHTEHLPEDVAISLRRPRRDAQPLADLVVRETLCYQLDDLALPFVIFSSRSFSTCAMSPTLATARAGCTSPKGVFEPNSSEPLSWPSWPHGHLLARRLRRRHRRRVRSAGPDAEVHGFVDDLERSAGTHLYGRRLYEVLVVWESIDKDRDQPPFILDFAQIWQAADKMVYSRAARVGKRALPDGVRVDLELLDERRFASGFIYLRYGKRS